MGTLLNVPLEKIPLEVYRFFGAYMLPKDFISLCRVSKSTNSKTVSEQIYHLKRNHFTILDIFWNGLQTEDYISKFFTFLSDFWGNIKYVNNDKSKTMVLLWLGVTTDVLLELTISVLKRNPFVDKAQISNIFVSNWNSWSNSLERTRMITIVSHQVLISNNTSSLASSSTSCGTYDNVMTSTDRTSVSHNDHNIFPSINTSNSSKPSQKSTTQISNTTTNSNNENMECTHIIFISIEATKFDGVSYKPQLEESLLRYYGPLYDKSFKYLKNLTTPFVNSSAGTVVDTTNTIRGVDDNLNENIFDDYENNGDDGSQFSNHGDVNDEEDSIHLIFGSDSDRIEEFCDMKRSHSQ